MHGPKICSPFWCEDRSSVEMHRFFQHLAIFDSPKQEGVDLLVVAPRQVVLEVI